MRKNKFSFFHPFFSTKQLQTTLRLLPGFRDASSRGTKMGFEAILALPSSTTSTTSTPIPIPIPIPTAVPILMLMIPLPPTTSPTPATTTCALGPNSRGLDLGGALADDDGVALDVLPVHLLGGLEELVGVAEGDEAVAAGLARDLVADDARLLQGPPPRERLEQRLVRRLAREVPHEQPQVRRVPLQQRVVRPLLAPALPHHRLLLPPSSRSSSSRLLLLCLGCCRGRRG